MPIDASNSPYDGGLGSDPASTKIGADDVVVASKTDVDLDDAGNGAKSAEGLDLPGTNAKAGLDLSLDDAGQGAKIDPSLRVDDDTVTPADKSGLGGALDQVDDGPVKDLDIGASDHLHEDHIKGLTGVSDVHDDDHDHDHDDLHDHGHDHGHDDVHD